MCIRPEHRGTFLVKSSYQEMSQVSLFRIAKTIETCFDEGLTGTHHTREG